MVELSVQFNVMALAPTLEKVNAEGAEGTGGVNPNVLPDTGLALILFVSTDELTLVPALFTERKLPDPVVEEVIPVDAEGSEVLPLSGL